LIIIINQPLLEKEAKKKKKGGRQRLEGTGTRDQLRTGGWKGLQAGRCRDMGSRRDSRQGSENKGQGMRGTAGGGRTAG
jgi:hypothetical protein